MSGTSRWLRPPEPRPALRRDDAIDRVLLDELNIALKQDFFDLSTVLEDLAKRLPYSMWSSPVAAGRRI